MRVALLAVLAVAVAVIAYLLISGGGGSNSDNAKSARIVTGADLRDLAGEVGHPIYWAGERPGTRLEFHEDPDGNVFVRYLTGDAAAGDPNQRFLTIGTYFTGNAVSGLEVVAKRKGAITAPLPGGGIVVTNTSTPTSVYLADQGSDYQVEVYDPDPRTALRLATSGEVVPLR
jgi:hypothetical protein